MRVFLLTILTGKKATNLYSKPVLNSKEEWLHSISLSCLEKSKECNFEIMPMTMGSVSMSAKVTRMLLKELSSKTEVKLTPIEK